MASKPDDHVTAEAAANVGVAESTTNAQEESENEDEEEREDKPQAVGSSSQTKKKKKSKKKRIKAALGLGGDGASDSAEKQKQQISKVVEGLSKAQIQELLAMNPALAQELSASSTDGDLTGDSVAEQMKRLKVCSLSMAGLGMFKCNEHPSNLDLSHLVLLSLL
jgi:glycylpeptide N-tetradecanoyltransferase